MASYFEIGYPIWYFMGYKYEGVNPENGMPRYMTASGEIKEGSPSDDDKYFYLGKPIPDATYGLTVNLAWRNFDKAAQAGSDVPVLYDKLFRAPQGGDQNVIWEHGSEANSRFYTVSTHEAKDNGLPVGYVAGKEYFPFPDISKRQNPQLNQLPYWGGGAQ